MGEGTKLTKMVIGSRSYMLAQFDNVIKIYKNNEGLKGCSFSIPAGQFVGLLGLNGSGKTTTLKLLSGLLAADRGKVMIQGSPPRSE